MLPVANPCAAAAGYGCSAIEPTDWLAGEGVESGHSQFEMFFVRVLDFVVGDAVEGRGK
jgi:hypothetical protein